MPWRSLVSEEGAHCLEYIAPGDDLPCAVLTGSRLTADQRDALFAIFDAAGVVAAKIESD